MLLAFGRNGARDTDLVPKEYTWDQLAQRLARPSVGEKDGSYLIRGGQLREPKRGDENLLRADLLVIDGDSRFDPETGEILTGAPPIEAAKAALDKLGYRYIIHTSFSYVPGELWKYRIYIPAAIPDTMTLSAAVNMVIEQLNTNGCPINDVKENHVWSQPWYLPRCRPEYVDAFKCFASLVGKDVDIGAAVAVQKARTAAEAVVKAQQELPPRERTYTGESPIEAFNRQAGFATVRVLLENAGYKFAGKRGDVMRFIAPGSESGTPGVTVFKGSQRGDLVTYSHHGGHDPLSHRLTDAFGLLTRLRHGGNEEAALAEAKEVTGWKPGEREVNLDDFEEVDPSTFREPPRRAEAGPQGPLFILAKAFADGWKPAEYLVDGLIQRGYCYSLTSPTGHGKTSVIMTLAACIGTGRQFAAAETLAGRVGYFAAENPNDVQARWIGLQEHMGFDDANVWFCPETIDLKTTFDKVSAEVEAAGGFDLIVVDTSQAFFTGTDENSNAEMVAHAKAMRKLTTLPGNPCVIILTHPVKNPSKDNLLPRGGGGFLAEVDGNLTIWNDGGNLELHHQGKFRGAGFAPLNFVLRPVTPARLVDAKGRQIPTVVADFVTEQQYEVLLEDLATDQDKVMLMILSGEGRTSVAEMATRAGWKTPGGLPLKSKVHRLITQLKAAKLVSSRRDGRLELTPAGEREIKAKAKALGLRTKARNEPENDDDDSRF